MAAETHETSPIGDLSSCAWPGGTKTAPVSKTNSMPYICGHVTADNFTLAGIQGQTQVFCFFQVLHHPEKVL